MNTLLSHKKRLFTVILLLLLVASVPLAVYLSQQQQDVRQQAAGNADLVVESLQLTDAGGNVRTSFMVNEDIYVRIRLKNAGGEKGVSSDGSTHTVIYANRSSKPDFNSLTGTYITMKNGEFGAGSNNLYESIYGSPSENRFPTNKSWRLSTPGSYTARAFINFNKFVTESNYDNNHLTVSYSVTSTPTYKAGKISTTKPTGFEDAFCFQNAKLVTGLDGCVMDKPVGSKTYGKITNTGSTTRTVGMASYKAYYDYPDPYPSCNPADCIDEFVWIWTQTIYSGVTTSLSAGKTMYFEVDVPPCAWQTDVFEGNIFPSFTPPDRYYSGQKKYIDGYLHRITPCKPVIPTPTPTHTPTPTLPPSVTPTVTNTPTPTHTPTPTPSATPTITPTPTIPACPVPSPVTNVRIICPNCSSPTP